jgi:hypothetical protein
LAWAFGFIPPKVHLLFFMIPVGNVFNRWGYASVLLAENKNAGVK